MSSIKFLYDEDVREALVAGLLRVEPGIDILAVGDANGPPKGTLDPALLVWAEREKYTLISRDRSTMRDHVIDHLAAGHHTWGVFLLRQQRTWSEIIECLILIWSASQAEDWQDRIEWIPW